MVSFYMERREIFDRCWSRNRKFWRLTGGRGSDGGKSRKKFRHAPCSRENRLTGGSDGEKLPKFFWHFFQKNAKNRQRRKLIAILAKNSTFYCNIMNFCFILIAIPKCQKKPRFAPKKPRSQDRCQKPKILGKIPRSGNTAPSIHFAQHSTNTRFEKI